MRKSRRRRTFCLSTIAALGLMGVGAEGAQAAEFWVGKEGSFLLTLASTTTTNSTIFLIFGRGITISCSSTVDSLHIITKTTATNTTEMKGCTVLNFSDNKELPACEIEQPIKTGGTLLPGEHSATKRVIYEPTAPGETFTTIVIKGAACASKGSYPLKGSVSAKFNTNGAVVNEVQFSQTYSELVGDTLKFGAFAAFTHSIHTVKLVSAHEGTKFGVS
jgi:hypothetical protein